MYRQIIFVILILFLSLSAAVASSRTALVIGNGSYKASPLNNSVNDANDMANVLTQCGFNVTLKINASQREMKTSVRSFGKNLRQDGGIGLFYYAGHGIQLNGRNYLIPVNNVIESEGDVEFETLDAGLVLNKMEDAGNDLNIVILDACRNNPFARGFRSPSSGLARMDAPKGSIVAYATSPGQRAADGEGRNGVYTKYLIKNIQNPRLTIEQVFKNVRVAVVSETSNKQIPWESSSLMGTFQFSENNKTAEKINVTKTDNAKHDIKNKIDTANTYELEFWAAIKNSKNPKMFEAYIKKYPNGQFAALSKIKIEENTSKKAQPNINKSNNSTITYKSIVQDDRIIPGTTFKYRPENTVLEGSTNTRWYFDKTILNLTFHQTQEIANMITEYTGTLHRLPDESEAIELLRDIQLSALITQRKPGSGIRIANGRICTIDDFNIIDITKRNDIKNPGFLIYGKDGKRKNRWSAISGASVQHHKNVGGTVTLILVVE